MREDHKKEIQQQLLSYKWDQINDMQKNPKEV